MFVVYCFNSPVAQVISDPEEGLRIITLVNSNGSDFIKFDSFKAARAFGYFIKEFCDDIPVAIREVK